MRTARELGHDALVELFNRAYSDYFMPLRLDAGAFSTMVEVSDLDLRVSPVAELDGAPAGLALLGLRGSEGWIGGMGVVPEARRRGLGRELMQAAIAAARRCGVHVLRLEVLEQNEPAIQLYRHLGFEFERELDVWSLGPAESADAVEGAAAVDLDEARRWIAAQRASREPWQRADATLAHLCAREPPPAALELRGDGERVAAAVYTSRQIVQLATAGRDDRRAARNLLTAVRAHTGGVYWLNAPAAEPGSAAMEELGATRVARQHELVLALGP